MGGSFAEETVVFGIDSVTHPPHPHANCYADPNKLVHYVNKLWAV